MPTAIPGRDRPGPPPSSSLHHHPPASPASFYRSRRPLLVGLGVAFVLLALGAAIANGALLLTWDEPVQRSVEDARTSGLDEVFLTVSRLGSTPVVLALGGLTALLTWRRCRAVGYAVVAATLARPAIEWMLKATVDRPRPDLERLVPGNGPSFPTGHVLAAVAIYGLLPLVVGLYTRRRWLWWSSVGMAGAVIFLVGASRVYLGVHWLSDVVGSMVLASFFLLGVEWVLHRSHDLDACAPCPAPGAVERPG